MTATLLNEAAWQYFNRSLDLDQAAIDDALDPGASIARRDLFGGPARASQEATLVQLSAQLDFDRITIEEFDKRIETAAARLEEAIDRILHSRSARR